MPLSNYPELQASVASWLKNDTLTSFVPDFITLAEARIARDLRLRRQVANTTLATVAGTQTVALPSDWLETENITLMTSSPKAMSVVTPEWMDIRFPAGISTGEPRFYAVVGNNIVLGPTPDAVYNISLDYYQRFAALSVTPTNWLLTNHPNVYLSAALHEGFMYTMEEERAMSYLARYMAEVKQLQDTDDAALRSGSEMRVRAV